MQIKEFKTEHFLFKNYTELTPEENFQIWEGRNHPDIRKWMTNPKPFSYESHCTFIDGLKFKTDCLLFAAIHDGAVVGSMDLNPYDAIHLEGEMGKFLLPNYGGKGLGTMMTKDFLEYFFINNFIKKVYIKTLISNEQNQHVNKKLGFVVTGKDDIYVYMTKIL